MGMCPKEDGGTQNLEKVQVWEKRGGGPADRLQRPAADWGKEKWKRREKRPY